MLPSILFNIEQKKRMNEIIKKDDIQVDVQKKNLKGNIIHTWHIRIELI